MKKYLITVLILSPFFILAQNKREPDLASDSIISEIIKGKEFLISQFLFGYPEKSVETLYQLNDVYGDKYIILTTDEEKKFFLATRNFKRFIRLFNNPPNNYGKSEMQDTCNFEADLNSYLISEVKSIWNDLDTSIVSKTESDFIKLYLRSFEDGNQLILNNEIDKFNRSNPESRYSEVLSELKKKPKDYMVTLNMAFGNQLLKGSVTNYFSKDKLSIFQVEFDGFYKRLYASFLFGGNLTSFESTKDLPVKNKDLIHKAGEAAENFKAGIKTGYVILRNRYFAIYPYCTAGINNMYSKSSEFDFSDEEESYLLSDSFYSGIGMSCDIYLKRWQRKYEGDPDITLYLRPNAGYDRLLSKKDVSKGEIFYFTFAIGIGLSNF
ncbi:MAG: hypothetical protein JW833_06185 [Prolixibacteraceae bacterium]|nr:hypothetical protein [Prolixibacteraceae bacterium]